MDYALPDSQHLDIDVGAFSRLFADVTNSYKFLFLLALFEILEKKHFQETQVELNALQGHMLSLAWYPHVYFKLSFGKQDKVSRALQKAGTDLIGSEIKDKDRTKLAAELAQISKSNPDIFGDLLRFVPFRLIRPFFSSELRGLPDEKINRRVAELSETYFFERKPLYKISSRPKLHSLVIC